MGFSDCLIVLLLHPQGWIESDSNQAESRRGSTSSQSTEVEWMAAVGAVMDIGGRVNAPLRDCLKGKERVLLLPMGVPSINRQNLVNPEIQR